MERIRGLIAEANRYLGQMTKRERMLVALAGVSGVIFILSIVFGSISSAIRRRNESIEEKMQSLQQVAVFSQSFNETERTRKDLEGRLGGQPLRLLSHLQEKADSFGLTIGSANDRNETTTGQVKEALVEISIPSASIDKLTKFLTAIEQTPRIVKVKKLRVRRNTGTEETLNVTLTAATYSLVQGG